LKLKYDKPLSNFAFNLNMCHYTGAYLGVFFAVPLRPHFLLESKLRFPSAGSYTTPLTVHLTGPLTLVHFLSSTLPPKVAHFVG